MALSGASYYRMVAQGLAYGLSARGLAVDTVGGTGEEFPAFTTFWFHRPQPGDTEVRFYALLRVSARHRRLWLRAAAGRNRCARALDAACTGVALRRRTADQHVLGRREPARDRTTTAPRCTTPTACRSPPAGGEWLWRPLSNPRGVFVTSFAMPKLRGYGLMQRDRTFTSYHDLEARYDLRPSAWIEPLGDWGPGRVELMQFNTPNETNDNIGAYWVPDRLPPLGQPVEFAWRMTTSDSKPSPPGAWVVQSRRGHGYREWVIPAAHMQYHIDFAGPALEGADEEDVEAVATGNANVSRPARRLAPQQRDGWLA